MKIFYDVISSLYVGSCVCGFFALPYPFIHHRFFFSWNISKQTSYKLRVLYVIPFHWILFVLQSSRAREKSSKRKKRTSEWDFFTMSWFSNVITFYWVKKATLAKLINVRQALWERSFTLSKYLIAWAWCNLFFFHPLDFTSIQYLEHKKKCKKKQTPPNTSDGSEKKHCLFTYQTLMNNNFHT